MKNINVTASSEWPLDMDMVSVMEQISQKPQMEKYNLQPRNKYAL